MKNRHPYIIAWFLILCISACSERNGTDTSDRAAAFLDSAQTLSGQSQHAQAVSILDSAMAYSNGNDTLMAYIYAEKANNLMTIGRMEEALPLAKQALSLGEKLNDNEILINQYSTTGIIYRRTNIPDSALMAYRKGIDIARKVDAKDYVANLYNNIAVMFVEQDRYKEGTEYAALATKWAREAKDSIELFSALATKSAAMLRMKRYKESAEAISSEFKNILALGYVPLTLKTASPMLRSLVELGKTAEAQTFMQQIQPALQAADPTSNGAIGILEIQAALLHSQGDYRKELALLNRLDTLTKQNGGIPRERILVSQADCLGKLGDTSAALRLMNKAYALTDSLKNSGMSRQMTEFTVKYKTQEKELMIAQLAAERANQQSLITILILALVLLAAGILFALYRRHIARKENELALQRRFIEGLESERARLARELHDGVCNDLLGVQLALDSGQSNAAQLVRHIMTDVRQISHELMPPRFTMENVAQILSDYMENIPLPDCKVDFRCTPAKDDEQWDTVNTAVSFDIYRIIQELTGNIVRHAKPSFINVTIEKNDGQIHLTVENDGAEGGSDGQGIGLQSMAVRVKSLNGEISHADMGNGRYRVEVEL
ncbi:tetratricopeptide repeat-containing sensor histidine kinase [Palleniella muris]|uniref:Tetratricopeptide repeat-containing sensor histidine kinase n=1 Tax=Palleniella muris TaxID=3038145 RepID=A0AC61QTE2_9BACT|nr:tetratricopeptide repeat-containing sensor histidine kinase [Palleniella muris]TGX83829.1 tetratricopeptide repeat-containing sensor histidine kinase [Palleniella muris]